MGWFRRQRELLELKLVLEQDRLRKEAFVFWIKNTRSVLPKRAFPSDPRTGTVIKPKDSSDTARYSFYFNTRSLPFFNYVEFIEFKKSEERVRKIEREFKDMVNKMKRSALNQNAMTRQDYITAIRNGEYCIENDNKNSTIKLLKEVFPHDTYNSSGTHRFYYQDVKHMDKWAPMDKKPMKSIKASILANMKDETKIITPDQAQRIIDIACTTWKPKLSKQWAESIVLKEDIEVHQAFYDVMRSACTSEQHNLFDEIFGTDVPVLKAGDCIVLLVNPSTVWELRDDNKLYSLNWGTGMWQQKPADLKFRHATPEEIRAAQYPPDGTPCWVRNVTGPWHLRYATGDGKFYKNQNKSGETVEYTEFKPFDPNNLPFNE